MRIITVCIIICSFFLLRPYQMQKLGLSYRGDDYSYFAHATSIAYGQYPSYEKEFFTIGKKSPHHSIGPGIMASPFVFLFSLIDRVTGADIVDQRTKENIRQSWSMYGFVISTSFYFWLACLMLYKSALHYVPRKYVICSVILLVLIQGIPLYVFRRPIFSHVYEFFLQSVMVYYFLKPKDLGFFNKRQWLTIGVALGLMPLVRYNNIIAAVMWWVILLFKFNVFDNPKKNKGFIISLVMFVFVIGLFLVLPNVIHQYDGYSGKLKYFFSPWWLLEYPHRLFNVLFGLGWGLVYTAPFALIGIYSAFRLKYELKQYLLLSLIPMAVNFHIIVTSAGQGGYYGYRYFIFSIVPLLVFPFAKLLSELHQKYASKVFWLICLIALFPLFSMLCFEGNNTTLTLSLVELHNGWGYSNHTYQLEVWKLLFLDPIQWMIAVFKGGLLYCIYVLTHIFHQTQVLPQIVLEKYPVFRLDILVKVLFIYLMPIILFTIVKKFKFVDK